MSEKKNVDLELKQAELYKLKLEASKLREEARLAKVNRLVGSKQLSRFYRNLDIWKLIMQPVIAAVVGIGVYMAYLKPLGEIANVEQALSYSAKLKELHEEKMKTEDLSGKLTEKLEKTTSERRALQQDRDKLSKQLEEFRESFALVVHKQKLSEQEKKTISKKLKELQTSARVPVRWKIIWADDDPGQDVIQLAGQLRSDGFEILFEKSTRDAVDSLLLHGSIVAVVSDMYREEHGAIRREAGLELARAIRSRDPALPFIIYTTDENTREFEGQARAMSILITASPLEIKNHIRQARK